MFKYNLSKISQRAKNLLNLKRNHQNVQLLATTQRLFSSSKSDQNSQHNPNYNKHLAYMVGASGLLLFAYQSSLKEISLAEESKEENNNNQKQEASYQQPSFRPFLKKTLDQFEIPKLIKERELQKQKEYQEREVTDVDQMEKGISQDDFKQMRELDRMFRALPDEEAEEDLEEEEAYIKDPYAKKKALKMKHQEYRTIQVGPPDLLKNGQLIQVSVCDPFDEEKFHPTDKVIIAKHNDSYHAVGSFCGFDYTNLATGAFLGEKLICPTCGSVYNIENGYVDQGPSLRNISSFLIQQREEKIQLVMPEHVPAFATKRFLKRESIDPRTFVILGDSETTLAAIDALRASYTGRIIVISPSAFGQFENTDILNKKFQKLDRNEIYMVEEDYLDRANIEIIRGDVSNIDLNKNLIVVRGQKKPIEFDKVLVAWGSHKRRISSEDKEYTNVYYLEDKFSHAKCHNEMIKAKTIVIMGGTFEAYQTAASVRDYLDSIGYTETQIILMDHQISEVQACLGFHIAGEIHQMLKEKRISVMMNTEVTKISGIDKIESIYFKKPGQKDNENEKNVEFYIKPDIIIAENGLGMPKFDLQSKLAPATHAETNEPPLQIGIDPQGIPASDIKFSLHYNDNHSPIFAAGSCTQYPSFVHKVKLRTNDIKYNIEAGFFAAMNMLDKRVEFRYFPFTPMKIGDTPVYFVGERNQGFHEIIINGNVKDRKFVAFFVYGNEVVGFVTVGYQNLHLYLWEAMKLLVMPPATQLRNETLTYKDIVKQVLRMRPVIQCKRHDIIKIPSIMLAEFDHELDKSADLSRKVKANIDRENIVQKEKFKQLKAKYDREGIEYVEDEMDIVDGEGRPDKQGERANTRSGARKPGGTSSGENRPMTNINMGTDNDNQKNPFSMMINFAKKSLNE